MSTKIILFPTTKRIGTIRKWGYSLACYPKITTREKVLRHRLNTFAEGLRKIGFAEDEIARETTSLEAAIRQEISRLMMVARAGRFA